jgi:hypothetical protein
MFTGVPSHACNCYDIGDLLDARYMMKWPGSQIEHVAGKKFQKTIDREGELMKWPEP